MKSRIQIATVIIIIVLIIISILQRYDLYRIRKQLEGGEVNTINPDVYTPRV